ncbi:hypothetical protein ACROYT_G010168 [Oculina patagonica]
MVVVYSKEKPLHCGNCKEKLETACFRCLDCAEIVSCPKCDPRGYHEDQDPPARPFVQPPCSRGGLASRGRGEAPHFACPRGGFSARGRGFDGPHFACPRGGISLRGSFDSQHRPNFITTVPFPGANRGCGFGFGGFPPRCPFPTTFGPMSEQGGMEDFSGMHGRGFGFPPRGGAGFSRGVPGRGMARGRGGFGRGRGGFTPFPGFQGMGCDECECNHPRVFPEVVEENIHDEKGGACNCVVPEMGKENIPDERGVADVPPEMVEESTGIHDAKGGAATEPVCIDHEG